MLYNSCLTSILKRLSSSATFLHAVDVHLPQHNFTQETHELKNAMLAGRGLAELHSAMPAQEPVGRHSAEDNVPDPRC